MYISACFLLLESRSSLLQLSTPSVSPTISAVWSAQISSSPFRYLRHRWQSCSQDLQTLLAYLFLHYFKICPHHLKRPLPSRTSKNLSPLKLFLNFCKVSKKYKIKQMTNVPTSSVCYWSYHDNLFACPCALYLQQTHRSHFSPSFRIQTYFYIFLFY